MARISVRRIFDPAKVPLARLRHELRACEAEERPTEKPAAERPERDDAAHPAHPAAAHEAEQQRLELVIGVVSREQNFARGEHRAGPRPARHDGPMDLKTTLHGYLRSQRRALVSKLDGLDEYDVRRPLTPTATNLLGLVKHVASVPATMDFIPN